LYQAWLLETARSHASLTSASPYYEQGETTPTTIHLLPAPRDTGGMIEAKIAMILHVALSAYNRLLDGEPLAESLDAWVERSTKLTKRLAARPNPGG